MVEKANPAYGTGNPSSGVSKERRKIEQRWKKSLKIFFQKPRGEAVTRGCGNFRFEGKTGGGVKGRKVYLGVGDPCDGRKKNLKDLEDKKGSSKT